MFKGWTKAWRKELASEIWLMPPLYLKVWYFLRHKVQHEPYLFPTHKHFGIWVLPGQRLTSLQEIAEGVKWCEWGREVIPNKKTISTILEWMQNEKMIEAESNGKGTLISILNWDTYNHVIMDESNGKETAKKRPTDTRKELKEGKEEKIKPLCAFDEFWKAYPKKKSKGQAEKAWGKITQPSETLRLILDALKWQKVSQEWTKENGQYIPYPASYLNAKGWEDERMQPQLELIPALRGTN